MKVERANAICLREIESLRAEIERVSALRAERIRTELDAMPRQVGGPRAAGAPPRPATAAEQLGERLGLNATTVNRIAGDARRALRRGAA